MTVTLDNYCWTRAEKDVGALTAALRTRKGVILYGPRGYAKGRLLRRAAGLSLGDIAWLDVPRLGEMEPAEQSRVVASELRVPQSAVEAGLQLATKDSPVKLIVFDGFGVEGRDSGFARDAYDFVSMANSNQRFITAGLFATAKDRVDAAAFEPSYFPNRFYVWEIEPLEESDGASLAAATGATEDDARHAIRFTGGNPRWSWLVACAASGWEGNLAALDAHLARAPDGPLSPWWAPVDRALAADLGLRGAATQALRHGGVPPGATLRAARLIAAGIVDVHGGAVPAARLRYGG